MCRWSKGDKEYFIRYSMKKLGLTREQAEERQKLLAPYLSDDNDAKICGIVK